MPAEITKAHTIQRSYTRSDGRALSSSHFWSGWFRMQSTLHAAGERAHNRSFVSRHRALSIDKQIPELSLASHGDRNSIAGAILQGKNVRLIVLYLLEYILFDTTSFFIDFVIF